MSIEPLLIKPLFKKSKTKCFLIAKRKRSRENQVQEKSGRTTNFFFAIGGDIPTIDQNSSNVSNRKVGT